mmetsp:Transcript_27246/g.63275  ORF Transcript_27246/g.63275 Transcript_27246/m.63275 type:complete len:222 (-) Transcript_27246:65-730(-)
MPEETRLAILQNNLGVEYLQEGDHSLALQHFEAAAFHLYQIAHIFQNRQTSGSETIPAFCQDTVVFSKEESILNGGSLICSNPIVLHEQWDDNISSECYTLQSAAILYNMGLTYHLSFLRPHSLDNSIRNAMNLYDMAYSLAVQEARGQEESPLVVMAALNNLGELHHELGEFETSRLYLENLTAYISSLDDPSERKDAIERHEFMLNSMILRAAHGAAAA